MPQKLKKAVKKISVSTPSKQIKANIAKLSERDLRQFAYNIAMAQHEITELFEFKDEIETHLDCYDLLVDD